MEGSRRGKGKKQKQTQKVPVRFLSYITVGIFRARQCLGADPVTNRETHDYRKPLLGISDMAQLRYCESKATLSQIASQGGYLTAAGMDDGMGGVGKSPGRVLTLGERSSLLKLRSERLESGSLDWSTRREIGKITEDLEMSEISTERRHFDFGEFYVIGVPDGLTRDSVIEFASSRYPQLAARDKQIQANVYALLWKVPRYHVIAVDPRSDRRLEFKDGPNEAQAENTIKRAWTLFTGQETASAPDSSKKCSRCIYNRESGCPYPREGRVPSLEEMKIIVRSPDVRRKE